MTDTLIWAGCGVLLAAWTAMCVGLYRVQSFWQRQALKMCADRPPLPPAPSPPPP